MAHELGHWKESHLVKTTLLDTAYMVLFGLLLQCVENSAGFLSAFGFEQASYFASLGLFVWLFMVSVDPVLKVGIHANSRNLEHRADSYSTQLGFGVSL